MHRGLLKLLLSGGAWGPQCTVFRNQSKNIFEDGTLSYNCEKEFSANVLALAAHISSWKRALKRSTLQLKTKWGHLGGFINIFRVIYNLAPPFSS